MQVRSLGLEDPLCHLVFCPINLIIGGMILSYDFTSFKYTLVSLFQPGLYQPFHVILPYYEVMVINHKLKN